MNEASASQWDEAVAKAGDVVPFSDKVIASKLVARLLNVGAILLDRTMDQGSDSGARTRHRIVPADFRAHSLFTKPSTLHCDQWGV
ncbi:hypothetical protein PoB_005546900 [Plakobranchus ocellatus]|uniref:Uncharacterized protein n=1 Tax=Plakobranchus ocellatus TaxID=259542 RepID=A0AAV4CDZ4_9GAST|nr:hypothetical protein PoB_005546900 [Plakobranchus ocellatus]